MWVSIAQKLLLDRLCTFLCCLGFYSLHFPFAYAKECTKFLLNSSLSWISNMVRSRKNYHSCSLVGFNYIIQVEKDLLRGGTHAKSKLPCLLTPYSTSSKVIYAKCYKTHMNLVTFCFWADWTILGTTDRSAILLKYPTFEGFFSCFRGQIIEFL